MNELDLFVAAVAVTDPAERAAFLDRECAGNAALRQRLDALLAGNERSRHPLDHSPAPLLAGLPADAPATATFGASAAEPTADHPSRDEHAGAVVGGKYTLVEPIGEGGMGSVWRAKQTEPVKRFVAVKLVKAGMDSKQVLARFEAERQALALMDHPHIAKVLDGGVHGGRPYFVMELVKGVPITDYCDAHKLTPKQRLELFVPVCQAIQHAHQKGVIHRDIKPSNVLVALYDDRPVVKVIDFGVAKATGGALTERTIDTGFGGVVGTPQYMSPEQATFNNLDIDTRSDVYALGVLLYELLAGSPPFSPKELERKGLLEMLRVVREEEPPRPSTRLSTADALPSLSANRGTEPRKLTGLLRNELDWIVMKALEKDRARRYDTANGFAADVLRYLSGEAVLAHPPSAGYRLRKLVRRNKGRVVAVGLVLVALVAGMAGTTWGLFRADQQRRAAEVARQSEAKRAESEAKERQRAEAGEKLAGDRLAQVATERDAKDAARQDAEAIATFLGDVFQSPDPARDGRTVTVAEALDRAAAKLAADETVPPARRATLQEKLGLTYDALGLYPQAIRLKESVREYRRKALGPEHPDTLTAINHLAISYHRAGRWAEALKLREEVLALRPKVSGPEHPDTLTAMSELAISYYHAGRAAEALKLWEEVVTLRRKVSGPEHPETLTAMNNLANSYHSVGRRAEALRLREVLTFDRKALAPEHPNTLTTMTNLAISYHDTGRRAEALKLRAEVLALRYKVSGLEHPDTLTAMSELALSYYHAGRRAEALKLREEVLTLRRKVLGAEHPDTLSAMHSLTDSYHSAGRRAEALKLREEVLTLRRKVLGAEHFDTLAVSDALSREYLAAAAEHAWHGRNDELAAACAKLLAVAADVPSDTAADRASKACSLRPGDAPRCAAALALARRAVELGGTGGYRAHFRMALGMAEYRSGHFAASDAALAAALDLGKKVPTIAGTAAFFRAMALFRQGKADDARTLAVRAAAAMRPYPEDEKNPLAGSAGSDDLIVWLAYREAKALVGFATADVVRAQVAAVREAAPASSPQLAGQLAALGLSLLKGGDFAEAEALLRECLAIRETIQPDDWATFDTRSMLGGVLLGQKKYADAEPLLVKGYEGLKAREKTIPPPVSATRLREAADRLSELYAALGKPGEAAKWRAERAKYPFVAPPPREKR